MIQAVYSGISWFIGTAVFGGCWLVTILVLGLLARIFGGKPEDEEE